MVPKATVPTNFRALSHSADVQGGTPRRPGRPPLHWRPGRPDGVRSAVEGTGTGIGCGYRPRPTRTPRLGGAKDLRKPADTVHVSADPSPRRRSHIAQATTPLGPSGGPREFVKNGGPWWPRRRRRRLIPKAFLSRRDLVNVPVSL